jgi:hypothetical protein
MWQKLYTDKPWPMREMCLTETAAPNLVESHTLNAPCVRTAPVTEHPDASLVMPRRDTALPNVVEENTDTLCCSLTMPRTLMFELKSVSVFTDKS